jgi:hypothetical protein
LGQALHYAAETNRKPKVILYCAESMDACLKDRLRHQPTISAYGLEVDLTLHDRESLEKECPRLKW